MDAAGSPTLRLAYAHAQPHARAQVTFGARHPPTVNLALGGPPLRPACKWDVTPAPALLVSYVYLDGFLKQRADYCYRDWVMDSGAYSAKHSGTEIDLTQYIETCRHLLQTDPTLVEVYALDVIGDWRATRKNTEIMWKAGVPAIPCFHGGEPEDALIGMAKDYPKIALGGATSLRGGAKWRWAAQCFARVWPKPIHGFGFGAEWAVMELPFHSVDATNWEAGPCRFGNWKTFGEMSIRGGRQDLRAEVMWHLRLEAAARRKWAPLWEQHPDLCNPSLREVV